MTLVLDPVWPWSRLYELLVQVPTSLRAVAVLGCVLMMLGSALCFTRQRSLLCALLSALCLSVIFLVGHLWPLAMRDGYGVSEHGFVGFLAGVAWLIVLVGLLLGPFALAGFAIATYVGTPNISRPKLLGIVALRLLAFFLAIIALARPALAWSESEQSTSVLYILIDRSRSMTIQDEQADRSRWQQTLRSLKESAVLLERLRDEHQVEVRYFAFDSELSVFDPDNPGEAEGNRTDFGMGLSHLFDRREGKVPIRGLLVISDGTDNGYTLPALAEAARWRGVPTTIHTFACGNPRTTRKQNDVALVSIATSPQPFVPVKGRLTVKVMIDARGFENSTQTVRLFIEGEDGKDREVVKKEVQLPLTTGNEVVLQTDAPARPGEVKVTVKVDKPEGDKFEQNNSIETFVNVSKEGISVLLVDKLRVGEPQAICDVLAEDPRVRVTPLWLAGGKPLPGSDAEKIFGERDAPFDVIILGDVSLAMLNDAALEGKAVKRIVELVGKGAGLIVLGGYNNLGNGEWNKSDLKMLLPVDLSMKEQIEGPVAMFPTERGLARARYIVGMGSNGKDNSPWKALAKEAKLNGATKLKLPEKLKGTELVLATTQEDGKGDPLLVMGLYGGGSKEKPGEAGVARVLVFGGDTTHRWICNDKFKEFFSRFWRQTIVWLAKQEDAEGQVWVRPDARRLPVRTDLGFTVGIRGKGGGPPVPDGKYDVEVITPSGQRVKTPISPGATENRGTFTNTQTPGVYRIVVRGEGTDPSGGKIVGEASSRVIVYDEDIEMSRPAADPEFLTKLASAGGGGESLRIEELPAFLNKLLEKPLERGRAKMNYRPDWQSRTRSPFFMIYFVMFSAIVSLEWGLRRWWGLK